MTLRAPFPWFGGKSRIAHLVWERFGDVPNYVEPFAGSLAVLLGRPRRKPGRAETVNDADGMLVNFWRAVAADPDAVARWADWPLTEIDLAARHSWMRERRSSLADALRADPHAYDVQAAGWWVWGLSGSLGEAWLRSTPQRPAANHPQQGIMVVDARDALAALQARLRRVTVLCGDWGRAVSDTRLSPSPAAVFLDPPYADDAHGGAAYATRAGLANEALAWALENGDSPALRLALCGYNEHDELAQHGWVCLAWKAQGGFGNRTKDGRGRENAARETVWFSPHCLAPDRPVEMDFFAEVT